MLSRCNQRMKRSDWNIYVLNMTPYLTHFDFAAVCTARDILNRTCICLCFMWCSATSLKMCNTTLTKLCFAKPDCTAHILIVNISKHYSFFFLKFIWNTSVTQDEQHLNISLFFWIVWNALLVPCPTLNPHSKFSDSP